MSFLPKERGKKDVTQTDVHYMHIECSSESINIFLVIISTLLILRQSLK